MRHPIGAQYHLAGGGFCLSCNYIQRTSPTIFPIRSFSKGFIEKKMNQSTDGRVKEVIVDTRINKILAMRTDSVAMLESLDAISEFYVSNTVEARRALRQDMEYQNIQLAKKFLAEFDVVKEKIEQLENTSIKLEESCETLANKVSDADLNMKVFLEKASMLDMQRNHYIQQSKEIQDFLKRFQLSAEEIDILQNASLDSPQSATTFFQSLKRLRAAYFDCKAIIENHTYTAGFELLDILGQHQGKATLTAYRSSYSNLSLR
jgi:hypothetical protein